MGAWAAHGCAAGYHTSHWPNFAHALAKDGAADGGAAAAAVRSVVGVRLKLLDATFLAALDAYIRAAAEKGTADVAGGCSGQSLTAARTPVMLTADADGWKLPRMCCSL